MSAIYDLLQLSVLTAQQLRSSDGDKHTPDCTHPHCLEERLARRAMEELPEHKAQQSSWVTFMKELTNAFNDEENPIVE
jgi:hypothetical protein